jgi:hypothetical protein
MPPGPSQGGSEHRDRQVLEDSIVANYGATLPRSSFKSPAVRGITPPIPPMGDVSDSLAANAELPDRLLRANEPIEGPYRKSLLFKIISFEDGKRTEPSHNAGVT